MLPKNTDHCWGLLKLFKKKPSQTLKDAVTEQFLAGYDTKKCYVDDPYVSDDDTEATEYNLRYIGEGDIKNSLEYARILYSHIIVDGAGVESEMGPQYAFKYCPPEVEGHYQHYFIADESSAPDKFAYDDSGGYPGVDFLDLEFLPNSSGQ